MLIQVELTDSLNLLRCMKHFWLLLKTIFLDWFTSFFDWFHYSWLVSFYCRERIDEILELWESLQKQTEFKGNKLKEASQQQQFNRNVEDIETWLTDIEGQLMSEDYGKVSYL